jgi:hypothetical protein
MICSGVWRLRFIESSWPHRGRQTLTTPGPTTGEPTTFARQAAWVRALGRPPGDCALRGQWVRRALTVAAYVDRHGTLPSARTGATAPDRVAGADDVIASHAIRAARHLAAMASESAQPYAAVRSVRERKAGPSL